MKIAVIGSTSRIGRLLLEEGVHRGHRLTAFTRRPEALVEKEKLAAIVQGDGRNLEDVRRAVQGQEAVITIVVGDNATKNTVATDVTRTVIEAMREAEVRRLIGVSAYPLWATRPWGAVQIVRWIFRHTYADLASMESEIVSSGLDWTIVRPTQLTNKEAAGQVRYERSSHDFASGPYSISRADVAAALLDLAENPSDVGVALAISGPGRNAHPITEQSFRSR